MPSLANLRETLSLRAFALWKIPMIAWVRPTVIHLDDARCEIRIPLAMRTRNHLKSMYFGALCVGADCAGGLLAIRHIRARKAKVSFVFKDFQADFVKRPDGDVHFQCDDGLALRDLVDKALTTGQRVELPMHLTATVPSRGPEPVARFVLTLSIKRSK